MPWSMAIASGWPWIVQLCCFDRVVVRHSSTESNTCTNASAEHRGGAGGRLVPALTGGSAYSPGMELRYFLHRGARNGPHERFDNRDEGSRSMVPGDIFSEQEVGESGQVVPNWYRMDDNRHLIMLSRQETQWRVKASVAP